MRHIEVTQFWPQEKVRKVAAVVNKIGTDDNVSDALSRRMGAAAAHKHRTGLGIEIRRDIHFLAPELDNNVKGAEEKLDDE